MNIMTLAWNIWKKQISEQEEVMEGQKSDSYRAEDLGNLDLSHDSDHQIQEQTLTQ